jgi:hypothetical protein
MLRARIATCGLILNFALSSCVISLSACASIDQLKAKQSPRPKKVPKRPPGPAYIPPTPQNQVFTIPDDESWSEVKPEPDPYTKNHSLGLNVIAGNFGPGVGLEYIHAEKSWLDWGVALRRTQASLDKEDEINVTEFIEADTNALRFFARYVQYKWLYAAATFDYSSIQGDYGWKGDAIVAGTLKTAFSAQVASLGLLVGSEWDGPWSSYIGFDWVGFAVPIFGSVDYDEQVDVEDTSKLLTGDDIKTRLTDETSAQMQLSYLNVRIGWRF